MRRILIAALLATGVLYGGCNVMGFIASPSYSEQSIPAEYKLRSTQKKKLLVFVDRAKSSNVSFSVAPALSEMVEVFLQKKVRISSKNIISSKGLSAFSRLADLEKLSPAEIGKKFGAGLVLYILIEDHNLYKTPSGGYYSGSLVTRSVLLDVDSDAVVWPVSGEGRVARTGFKLEISGREAAAERLNVAMAHCITRCFYNCSRRAYKISDEQTAYGIK